MPYIKPDRRETLAAEMDDENQVPHMAGPGELNYLITKLIKLYQQQFGLSYATINDILGALEGAKAEFYRRVAVPYENAKMVEHGDVY